MDRHRKIVQINQFATHGGAARISWMLHQAYLRAGHDSLLLVGELEGDQDKVLEIPREVDFPTARMFESLSNLAARTRARVGGETLARFLWALRDPRRVYAHRTGLEDFNYPGSRRVFELLPFEPDLIHLHNLHGDYFDLRFLPELSARVPTFLTMHDAWLLTGHCAHPIDCKKWRTGCGSCPYLEIYPAVQRDATRHNWKRKRSIFSHAKLHLATPSRWLLDMVGDSMLEPAIADARIIPNGVDTGIFNPKDRSGARRRLAIADDVETILFVGDASENNPYKDVATVLRAVEIVRQQAPDREVLFLMVGGSETSGAAPLLSGGKAKVRTIQYQSDLRLLADYYRSADLYLQASRADTFPNVILEAMACGTPVIATRVGGIPEQILDGETGFVVGPSDSRSMAELALSLLTQPAKLLAMSQRAAEDARTRFDLQNMADRYLSWYREVLDGEGRH